MTQTKLYAAGIAFTTLALTLGNVFVGAQTDARHAAASVTFAKDVAPILQAHCQDCHRPGAMAPMSLISFAETRPWARSIRDKVSTRQMPPWHIDRSVGVQQFKNDISLSDDQIDVVVRWVDAGAPMGDPKDLPPAREWPTDNQWQAQKLLGPPDLVIKGAPYSMPAQGQDVWWKPTTGIPLTEGRWARAVEMRSQTLAGRRILHHAVAYLVQKDPDSNGPGGNGLPSAGGDRPSMFAEWAVGKQYDLYRPNTGKLLLPGAQIEWDMHLHAVGEEIRDGAELAIWLYPKGEEPKYRTYLTHFGALPVGSDGRFVADIAPNSIAMHEDFHVLRAPARLENFQPHMHLRGKAMALEAILPDGTRQTVSYVRNFNFNWMINYIYADDAAPVFPKGTVIHVTAWHDNTSANRLNPDPDQWVGYGDRTVDEMAHAWVNVTYISDEDFAEWQAKHKPARSTAPQH
jgi:hypothetical protein